MNKDNLKAWARKEVDLLIADDLHNDNYEIAYENYCNIVDSINGKLDPGIIKTVLIQLLNGFPLTPINDDDSSEWDFLAGCDTSGDGNWSIYQNKRHNSLLKKIRYDGDKCEVKYTDAERCMCIDINTNKAYTGGMGLAMLDKLLPITMPYFPIGKIKIYTEEFKAHKNEETDYDTIGVLYFKHPEGKMSEVMKFFKKEKDTKEFVEIDKHEYFARKKMSEKGV